MNFFKNLLFALNLLCFLFSASTVYYILAYVIFIPIAKELATKLNNPSISTATSLLSGAVASFYLVSPSPVIISSVEKLSANEDTLILLGFLLLFQFLLQAISIPEDWEDLKTWEPKVSRVSENNSRE